MNQKYTVIHNVYVGNNQYITRMTRLCQEPNETLAEALEREEIYDPQYIFHGHPPLEGDPIA